MDLSHVSLFLHQCFSFIPRNAQQHMLMIFYKLFSILKFQMQFIVKQMQNVVIQ